MVRIFFLLLLIGIGPSTVLAQQPGEQRYRDDSAMPEGIVGVRIHSLLQVLNADDPEQVRHFLEEACTSGLRNRVPIEQHLNAILGVARQSGGMTFHGIRTHEPTRTGQTVVIGKGHNYESWWGITLQFDASDQHRIASLRFSPARTPTNVEEEPLSEVQLAEETRQLLQRVCDQDLFSGTALLAKGDQVLVVEACGEASKRFYVANTIDTKFNLGSMNKMFTATAIAQLVEKGHLAFDEPISSYVDKSWLPRETAEQVTIHHLLTHTAGLGSYFNQTYWNGSRELYRSVNDFKPLVQGETLAFTPGARFQYSNTGMLLLGVIIESVTGQSYFDYVREHIYEPAGMTNSDSYEMDDPVENLAIGYIPAPGSPHGWKNNLYKHVIKGGPAGGGFSTVGDLHRFARALQTGVLVSEDSLERLWTDYIGASYGYGFKVEEGQSGTIVGHSGGFPGLNGNLDIFEDQDYIVAVLSNYNQAATPVAQRIKQYIAQTQSGN